jgi:hypothetical protein
MNVNIRVAVEDNTVDERTAAVFLQRVHSRQVLLCHVSDTAENDGVGHLIPDRPRAMTREDRPVKSQSGEAS